MKKRVFSLALSLALCFSLVGPAYARLAVDIDSDGNIRDIYEDTAPPADSEQKPPAEPSTSSSSSGNRGSETYAINISKVTGGTVTARPTSASDGVKVTITVTPDAGYTVGSITVTDKNGNKITVTNEGDNKYSFIMPKGAVTIDVEFVRGQGTVFTDVPVGAYYYNAVAWAVANGITAGTTSTTFSPNAPCTRAQIVSFLWRAAGSPKASGENPFTDVAAGSYYYDAVLWAVANGITAGTNDGSTFSPSNACSRGEIVTFLHRAYVPEVRLA